MQRSMASLAERVRGDIARVVIHDDSGDDDYRSWLDVTFPDAVVVRASSLRTGFSEAYRSAFAWLAAHDDSEWVFQTEDDFTYETAIDLDELIAVMRTNPHLVQMQLRRQPWGTEPADGGFVGQWPHFYRDASDGTHHWLEHRRNWSTNPGLFRRALCSSGWPKGPGSEGTFGDRLMASGSHLAFALWGRRDDAPTVHHIGDERVGFGY
jgi:hypothetical protein